MARSFGFEKTGRRPSIEAAPAWLHHQARQNGFSAS